MERGLTDMTTEPVLVMVVLIAAYIVASIFYPLLAGGAGYTPTPREKVAEALELVGLAKDEVFYDLGCGTGVALIEASKRCDHVRGVEIEPLRWLVARLRARKAKVRLGDLFKQDISDADVIFLFQYHGRINRRIAAKIERETRRGTRVVSYLHPVEGLELVMSRDEIFVYTT